MRRSSIGIAPNGFLAKTASDAGPGERAGDLGWAAESDIVPEIRTQVAGMTQGEISDPIRVQSGWHIIRLDDTRPAVCWSTYAASFHAVCVTA